MKSSIQTHYSRIFFFFIIGLLFLLLISPIVAVPPEGLNEEEDTIYNQLSEVDKLNFEHNMDEDERATFLREKKIELYSETFFFSLSSVLLLYFVIIEQLTSYTRMILFAAFSVVFVFIFSLIKPQSRSLLYPFALINICSMIEPLNTIRFAKENPSSLLISVVIFFVLSIYFKLFFHFSSTTTFIRQIAIHIIMAGIPWTLLKVMHHLYTSFKLTSLKRLLKRLLLESNVDSVIGQRILNYISDIYLRESKDPGIWLYYKSMGLEDYLKLLLENAAKEDIDNLNDFIHLDEHIKVLTCNDEECIQLPIIPEEEPQEEVYTPAFEGSGVEKIESEMRPEIVENVAEEA